MRIGIDIDDTIATTFEDMLPHMLEYFHLHENELHYEIGGYYQNILGISDSEFFQYARKYYDPLISEVGIKPNCKEVLKRLKEKGHEIIFITARSQKTLQDPEAITLAWLKQYEIPYDKLILSADHKKQICEREKIDLFIDDNIRNCMEVSTLGIPVYLIDSVMNQQDCSCKRVYDWLSIETLLESR